MKKQYRISLERELYERIKSIAKELEIPVASLIKLASKVNIKTVKVTEYKNDNIQIHYYAEGYKINKQNLNYKIARFLELFDTYFV